ERRTQFGMGEDIPVGTYVYNIRKVRVQSWIGDFNHLSGPGARFVLVTYGITNEGRESRRLPDLDMEIRDNRGRVFKMDNFATSESRYENPSDWSYSELHPGVPAQLTQVFILPKAAVLLN